ncbi:MAG TPA: response regulator [bacterium]|nr:response regulator [bacterium]
MSGSILIIEDNEQNMYLMRFMLENGGYRVREALDGRVGLRLAEEETPQAILLDIQLPEMDGYAVAAALRKIPALAAVPIIAVTSFAMPGDRERVMAAGATDYIEKPINPDTFVDQLRKYLQS